MVRGRRLQMMVVAAAEEKHRRGWSARLHPRWWCRSSATTRVAIMARTIMAACSTTEKDKNFGRWGWWDCLRGAVAPCCCNVITHEVPFDYCLDLVLYHLSEASIDAIG